MSTIQPEKLLRDCCGVLVCAQLPPLRKVVPVTPKWLQEAAWHREALLPMAALESTHPLTQQGEVQGVRRSLDFR